MQNILPGQFGAIFENQLLLNARRIAPYALLILFSANALLWWGRGPAIALGWATNSDFYIVRNLKGFSFLLGLPIFNAVIMGDAVIRDFRLGIHPLIFSKPIKRWQYLLGNFFGNFFVLVCCQALFPLTLLLLQAFQPSRMVVQPARVFPYFKHFVFFVVIPHMFLASLYFAVGTVTRNSKIVYLLAVCFYPVYFAFMVLMSGVSAEWRDFLDPFLLNSGPGGNGFGHSADFLNQYVVTYTSGMLWNRGLLIFATGICLAVVYLRFNTAERSAENSSTLLLTTVGDRVYDDSDSPVVKRRDAGNVHKLLAAVEMEFRLLRAERSLLVLAPLTLFLPILDYAFYHVVPEVSYSATYASGTAKTLVLFLVGISIFYTGEVMHRDRELCIEPVLWATPASNSVLLLSKFLATVLLMLSLVILVGLTALIIQLVRGHTPVEVSAYVLTYSIILLPGIVFLAAASMALNILLRDRYLTYAVSVGIAAGLFYLYSIGYNGWLHNPLLYQLWTYHDLAGPANSRNTILLHRIYCLGIAGLCLTLAHLFFERKSHHSRTT